MKIRMKVKDPIQLQELWENWAEENKADLEEIQESGGSIIMEPTVQQEISETPTGKIVAQGFYTTASGKGKYHFDGEEILTFEGYRGSFGQTKFFNISKQDEEIVLCAQSPYDPQQDICILLEPLSYETTAPKKPFEFFQSPKEKFSKE